MFGYIYITTNLINNKKYIGKHVGKYDPSYLGSGKIITYAIKKYGKNNFKNEMLAVCNSLEELNRMEKHFIKINNACKSEEFYNIAAGGDGGNLIAGYTEEELLEFKNKMSKVTSGENNGMYGKKHSEHSKMINSKSNILAWKTGINTGMKGKKHSKEAIKKISDSKIGDKNPMYNKEFTKEHRRKLSKSCTNKRRYECKCIICNKSFKGRAPHSNKCANCLIERLVKQKEISNKYDCKCRKCNKNFYSNTTTAVVCIDCKIIEIKQKEGMVPYEKK